MINKKDFRIECDCGDSGHFFTIKQWFGDDKEIYAILYEADRSLPFWTRLKDSLAYLFKKDNLNYLEVVFKKEDLKELNQFIIKEYKKL